MNVAVIGAGLFGQVIRKELIRRGCSVALYDDRRPECGSAPSGMLTKPSWYAGLGKDVYEPGLATLRLNYDVQEVPFKVGPAKVTGAFFVHPTEILAAPAQRHTVKSVDLDGSFIINGDRHGADLVIIAAGVWTSELIKVPYLEGKKGVSFIWEVEPEYEHVNRIDPWAPYKQIVTFRMDPKTIWAGDGTAILPENWQSSRVDDCLKRCHRVVKLKEPSRTIMGIRPYVPHVKPCYVERASENVWVATGGAKNGLIAAGWAAWKIGEALR